MKLGKNISIDLPEKRFSQEKGTTIGGRDCINISALEAKKASFDRPDFEVYITDFDLHVMEVFKTPVKASLPVVLYLTETAVELSVELVDGNSLEIGTYYRNTEGIHLIFEILGGIRFGNASFSLTPAARDTAIRKCLAALEADEEKKARKHEEALKRGAAIPGKISVYDPDISFDLPNGFEFYWKDLGDGDKGGRIITDISIDEEGDKQSGYMIVVEDGTPKVPTADFFEKVVKESLENASNASSCRLSHEPGTVLYTSSTKMAIFGTEIETIDITVLVSVLNNKILRMIWSGGTGMATPERPDLMEKMLKAVRAIRIHGRPIKMEAVDAKALWTNMYPKEHDGPVHEVPLGINLEVKVGDKTVSRKTIAEPKPVKKTKAAAPSPERITGDPACDTDPEAYTLLKLKNEYSTELERIEFEEEISRMKECSLINIPASLAELQRRNPNINWSRMEKYIRKTYNMTPVAWFKAEGIIGSRKKTEEPKKQAERTTKKTTPKSAKPSPIPFDTSKPLTIHSKNKTALEQLSEAEKAFSGTVIVEEGIKEIWSSACDSAKMKKLILPSSLRIIQEGAFYGCVNLEEVVIPDGLEEIKKVAFGNTPKLDNIGLPDSIRKIDKEAFVRSENDNHAHICIHISDKAAKNLVSFSKESPYVFYFYINNKPYDNLDTYKIQELDILEAARVQNKLEKEANEANEKKEEERRAAEERERQEQEELKDGKERFRLERLEIEEYEAKFKKEEEERQRQKEAEKADRTQQKQQRRAEILEKIIALEKELKPVKGMFGLLKRNKIQKQIDALKEQLNHL